MHGIKVIIYEKHNHLGGLLYNGIPEFRLPKRIVKKVTNRIIKLGIKVKYNRELGRNIELNKLKKEYDAVYIAIGANASNKMNIPGENLKCVYGANELLESNKRLRYKGKTIIISGGGNVSMDIARTVKRQGAKKAIIVYRREENKLTADLDEVMAAKKDGVTLLCSNNIVAIHGRRKVKTVELMKTEYKIPEGETSPKIINIPGSNYEMKANYVIMAIGSHQTEVVDNLPLEKNPQGKIKIDGKGKTSDKKVFAGGDVAGTKGTVAWAAKAGRIAALSIIEYLNERK